MAAREGDKPTDTRREGEDAPLQRYRDMYASLCPFLGSSPFSHPANTVLFVLLSRPTVALVLAQVNGFGKAREKMESLFVSRRDPLRHSPFVAPPAGVWSGLLLAFPSFIVSDQKARRFLRTRTPRPAYRSIPISSSSPHPALFIYPSLEARYTQLTPAYHGQPLPTSP